MDPIIVDFSVVKQKLIKTDEILQMYTENGNKLKKALQACKELKQTLERTQLENDRCTFSLESLKSKYNTLDVQHKSLYEQKISLEQKYNQQAVVTQQNIRDLEMEVQYLKELKKFTEPPQPKNTVGKKKLDELEEKLLKHKDIQIQLETENNKLHNENMALHEQISINKEQQKRIIDEFKEEKAKLIEDLHFEMKEKIKYYTKLCYDKTEEINRLKCNETISDNLKNHTSPMLLTTQIDIDPVKTHSIAIQTDKILEPSTISQNLCTKKNIASVGVEESLSDIFNEMIYFPKMLSPLRSPSPSINLFDSYNEPIQSDSPILEDDFNISNVDLSNNSAPHEVEPNNIENTYKSPIENMLKTRKYRRSKYLKKQQWIMKKKLTLLKRQHPLKYQDNILRALQILKRSKINFTISNESTIPIRCEAYNSEIQSSISQSLKKLLNMRLLNVKKETMSPAPSRMEFKNETRSHSPLEVLQNQLQSELTSHNILDKLAELVSEKIQNGFPKAWERLTTTGNSEYQSEIEKDLEHLFENCNNTTIESPCSDINICEDTINLYAEKTDLDITKKPVDSVNKVIETALSQNQIERDSTSTKESNAVIHVIASHKLSAVKSVNVLEHAINIDENSEKFSKSKDDSDTITAKTTYHELPCVGDNKCIENSSATNQVNDLSPSLLNIGSSRTELSTFKDNKSEQDVDKCIGNSSATIQVDDLSTSSLKIGLSTAELLTLKDNKSEQDVDKCIGNNSATTPVDDSSTSSLNIGLSTTELSTLKGNKSDQDVSKFIGDSNAMNRVVDSSKSLVNTTLSITESTKTNQDEAELSFELTLKNNHEKLDDATTAENHCVLDNKEDGWDDYSSETFSRNKDIHVSNIDIGKDPKSADEEKMTEKELLPSPIKNKFLNLPLDKTEDKTDCHVSMSDIDEDTFHNYKNDINKNIIENEDSEPEEVLSPSQILKYFKLPPACLSPLNSRSSTTDNKKRKIKKKLLKEPKSNNSKTEEIKNSIRNSFNNLNISQIISLEVENSDSNKTFSNKLDNPASPTSPTSNCINTLLKDENKLSNELDSFINIFQSNKSFSELNESPVRNLSNYFEYLTTKSENPSDNEDGDENTTIPAVKSSVSLIHDYLLRNISSDSQNNNFGTDSNKTKIIETHNSEMVDETMIPNNSETGSLLSRTTTSSTFLEVENNDSSFVEDLKTSNHTEQHKNKQQNVEKSSYLVTSTPSTLVICHDLVQNSSDEDFKSLPLQLDNFGSILEFPEELTKTNCSQSSENKTLVLNMEPALSNEFSICPVKSALGDQAASSALNDLTNPILTCPVSPAPIKASVSSFPAYSTSISSMSPASSYSKCPTQRPSPAPDGQTLPVPTCPLSPKTMAASVLNCPGSSTSSYPVSTVSSYSECLTQSLTSSAPNGLTLSVPTCPLTPTTMAASTLNCPGSSMSSCPVSTVSSYSECLKQSPTSTAPNDLTLSVPTCPLSPTTMAESILNCPGSSTSSCPVSTVSSYSECLTQSPTSTAPNGLTLPVPTCPLSPTTMAASILNCPGSSMSSCPVSTVSSYSECLTQSPTSTALNGLTLSVPTCPLSPTTMAASILNCPGSSMSSCPVSTVSSYSECLKQSPTSTAPNDLTLSVPTCPLSPTTMAESILNCPGSSTSSCPVSTVSSYSECLKQSPTSTAPNDLTLSVPTCPLSPTTMAESILNCPGSSTSSCPVSTVSSYSECLTQSPTSTALNGLTLPVPTCPLSPTTMAASILNCPGSSMSSCPVSTVSSYSECLTQSPTSTAPNGLTLPVPTCPLSPTPMEASAPTCTASAMSSSPMSPASSYSESAKSPVPSCPSSPATSSSSSAGLQENNNFSPTMIPLERVENISCTNEFDKYAIENHNNFVPTKANSFLSVFNETGLLEKIENVESTPVSECLRDESVLPKTNCKKSAELKRKRSRSRITSVSETEDTEIKQLQQRMVTRKLAAELHKTKNKNNNIESKNPSLKSCCNICLKEHSNKKNNDSGDFCDSDNPITTTRKKRIRKSSCCDSDNMLTIKSPEKLNPANVNLLGIKSTRKKEMQSKSVLISTTSDHTDSTPLLSSNDLVTVKRGRGRPRKYPKIDSGTLLKACEKRIVGNNQSHKEEKHLNLVLCQINTNNIKVSEGDIDKTSQSNCNTDKNNEKPVIKRLPVKKTKLQSQIMKQMKEQQKMFRQAPVCSSVNNTIDCDVRIKKKPDMSPPKDQLLRTPVNPNIQPNKKINVVQNILIRPDCSNPIDLLKVGSSERQISSPNKLKPVIARKKRRPAVKTRGDCDILSKILSKMGKVKSKKVVKSTVIKDIPTGINEKQWRTKILDIAEVIHNTDVDMKHIYGPKPCRKLRVGILKKKSVLPKKIDVLLKKLLATPNEDDIPEDIVLEFKRLTMDEIMDIIIYQVSRDIHDKPDIKYYPAPLMTRTQRLFLCLLVRLEKERVFENIIEIFFARIQEYVLRMGCGIRQAIPLTRLFLSLCRLHADIHRIRTFCCEAFFYAGDRAVPIFFIVLTSWSEVFPFEADVKNYPIAKVLVQLVHLKTCAQPGYNLIPLRGLLNQYYGYPKERWDCDKLFEEVYQGFLANPSIPTDYAVRLFCKNKDTKWVYKKLNEYFKPLIYKIPIENVNFKATTIILMGKICRLFKPNNGHDNKCLIELLRWFQGLLEDNPAEVLQQSIQYTIELLPKKGKEKKWYFEKEPVAFK